MSQLDMDALRARIARFKELKSSSEAFVDTRIPEYQREIYNIIGRGVTEDTRLEPMIADNRDFNLTMMKADPGKGSSRHDHETIDSGRRPALTTRPIRHRTGPRYPRPSRSRRS